MKILLICTFVIMISASAISWSDNGTTSNFRKHFLDKCEKYTNFDHQNLYNYSSKSSEWSKSCMKMWENFNKTVSPHTHPCNLHATHYETNFLPFIKLPSNMKDQGLLWSGVGKYVDTFASENNLTPVSALFMGYVVDKLDWCARDNTVLHWTKMTSCPNRSECKPKGDEYREAYWGPVSEKYASSLSGIVHIMLSGSSKPAYKKTSYLAKYEIPNLRKVVTEVKVKLYNTDTNSEMCKQDSIVNLEKEIKDGNPSIKYSCEEIECTGGHKRRKRSPCTRSERPTGGGVGQVPLLHNLGLLIFCLHSIAL